MRPRNPLIESKVVQACVDLLEEQGRSGLTRAQIAHRAGVSLPAVNRRYADVDAILLEVARTPGRLPRRSSDGEPQSLRDYLKQMLGSVARTFARDPRRRAAAELLAAKAGHRDIEAAFHHTLAAQRVEALAWVEQARTVGDIGPDVDGELLLDLVMGSAYYRLLWRGEAISTADVEGVVDLVLAGAAVAPARERNP